MLCVPHLREGAEGGGVHLTPFFVILQKTFGKGSEFQLLKQGHQRGQVGLLGAKFFFVKFYGNLQIDGSQHLRHQALLGKLDDILLLLAFQFVGVGDEVFYAAVFPHQNRCRLFTDARNAWNIVGGITPKS